MIQQWERDKLNKLKEQGYEFEITSDGYMVRLNGQFIGGAGVKLPREKRRCWQHARADADNNFLSALRTAERHANPPAPTWCNVHKQPIPKGKVFCAECDEEHHRIMVQEC